MAANPSRTSCKRSVLISLYDVIVSTCLIDKTREAEVHSNPLLLLTNDDLESRSVQGASAGEWLLDEPPKQPIGLEDIAWLVRPWRAAIRSSSVSCNSHCPTHGSQKFRIAASIAIPATRSTDRLQIFTALRPFLTDQDFRSQ
jgi:hypothetical protein